ncbi:MULTISPECIES: hypothetical protein [Cytobacillus]|uniref:hypothetical protein n=1 Tax=Cytobacillus TaxID=2675230 RepID=UPI001416F028|nr:MULTISPECIES: hypothetical protein [Cytobacillus]
MHTIADRFIARMFPFWEFPDDDIQHYYQVPYDWLQTLKINLTNDSHDNSING